MNFNIFESYNWIFINIKICSLEIKQKKNVKWWRLKNNFINSTWSCQRVIDAEPVSSAICIVRVVYDLWSVLFVTIDESSTI
jgi:hypothetical protein